MKKMSIQKYTIPVGDECVCGSLLEAQNIAYQKGIICDYINLMLCQTEDKPIFLWGCYNKDHIVKLIIPVFSDTIPSRISKKVQILQPNEYLKYGNNLYQLCKDTSLKEVIRQITIYPTAKDAFAAVYLLANANLSKDDLDIYIAEVSLVENPTKIFCYCWIIDDGKVPCLHPVFTDDFPKLASVDINSLNWQALSEDDTFWHNQQKYQICIDENDDEYIICIFKTQMTLIKTALK